MKFSEQATRHPFVGYALDGLGESRTPQFADDEPALVGFAPAGIAEPALDGDTVAVSGPSLYLPGAVAGSAHDEWTVRGLRYGQVGEPAVWRSPLTGWQPGTVILLDRRTG